MSDRVEQQRERVLDGGQLSPVVRIGDTVRRPTGAWTEAVHALLEHLEQRGFDCCPRVFGRDDQGREILSYLPGKTVGAARPWPAWTRSEHILLAVARWLRAYHRAVADFDQPPDTRWRLTSARVAPGEIICHNDVAPTNLAWDGERLGVFDWDVAGPGEPEDDLAFAAWNCVPLHTEAHCTELGWVEPVDRAARLRAFVDAYGLERRDGFVERIAARMQTSIDRIAHGAAAGDVAFQKLIDAGRLAPVRAARDRVLRDAARLQRAIQSGGTG